MNKNTKFQVNMRNAKQTATGPKKIAIEVTHDLNRWNVQCYTREELQTIIEAAQLFLATNK